MASNYLANAVPTQTNGRALVTADRMAPNLPAPVNPYLQQFGLGAPEPVAQSVSIMGGINAGLMFLRRQWWLIGLGVLLGCLLAPLGFVLAPPSYQAVATVMLLGNRSQSVTPTAEADVPWDNAAALESQLEIMRSDRISSVVLDNLKLRDDPEFKVIGEGRLARWFGPDIAELLGRSPIRSPDRIERYQLDILNKMVSVRRISGTFAVEIFGTSNSAVRAAQVANAVAEAYLADQIGTKHDLNHAANAWLTTELAGTRDELEAAKQAVIAFRFANNLDASATGQASDRRLTELSSQLSDVRAKAQENQIRLARVEKLIADYPTAAVKPVLPDQSANPVIQKLRERSYDLNQRLSDWTQRFGLNHEATQRVRKDIADVDAALLDEYQRLAASYRGDIEIAKASEATIAAAAKSASETHRVDEQALIKLRELESAVVTRQASYDSLLTRQAATSEMAQYPVARANIINRALEPNGKTVKKAFQMSGTMFLVGWGLCIGIALMRDLLNGSFLRVADVEGIFGERPVAVVPQVRKASGKLGWQRMGKRGKLLNTARVIPRDSGPAWACDSDPRSAFASAIRSIKLQIERPAGLEDKRGASVGVISTELNQGASTIAAAVAISAAASGTKVLLVDADIRHHALSAKLAPSATAGLLEAVDGKLAVEEMLWSDPATGLSFLPAGTPSGQISDDLLASDGFANLVSQLREQFDLIIFDLPALAPMMHVPVGADVIASYIAVVKWGRSQKSQTKLAFDNARDIRNAIDCVALNCVDTRKFKLYDTTAGNWFDEKRLRGQTAV